MSADCSSAGSSPARSGGEGHEDELVVAIRDLNPQAPVHLLLMPREHIDSALDLTRLMQRSPGDSWPLPRRSPAPRGSPMAATGSSSTLVPTVADRQPSARSPARRAEDALAAGLMVRDRSGALGQPVVDARRRADRGRGLLAGARVGRPPLHRPSSNGATDRPASVEATLAQLDGALRAAGWCSNRHARRSAGRAAVLRRRRPMARPGPAAGRSGRRLFRHLRVRRRRPGGGRWPRPGCLCRERARPDPVPSRRSVRAAAGGRDARLLPMVTSLVAGPEDAGPRGRARVGGDGRPDPPG